jgi:hypothetical protein
MNLDREDPAGALLAQFQEGLEGLSKREARSRLDSIEQLIGKLCGGRKLAGPMHDDLLLLKSLHQRYTNYMMWLETQA